MWSPILDYLVKSRDEPLIDFCEQNSMLLKTASNDIKMYSDIKKAIKSTIK